MVAIPGLGTSAPPTVRRPVVDLVVAGAGPDDWRPYLSAVVATAHLAPEVGAVTVLVGTAGAPAAAVGDDATLSLGFADDGSAPVASGTVAAVTDALDGTRTVTIHDAAADLAGLRIDQGYSQQSAGDIVGDLAGRIGVSLGRVDAGNDHPFLVVDARRSAWTHVARLARRSGLLARVDGDGRLVVAPPDEGAPLVVDPATAVLRVRSTTRGGTTGVTVVGEGAAGADGGDAWPWLARDGTSVSTDAGHGGGVRVHDPALRSPDAVRTAAEAELAARARHQRTAWLRVPGAPTARPGGIVEVTNGRDPLDPAGGALGLTGRAAAAGPGAGRWLVTGVRHRVAGAFTTDLDLVAASTGSGLPDLGF